MNNYLTVKQAAEYCGVSDWNIYGRIRSGKLVPIKIGPMSLFTKEQLDQYIAKTQRKKPRITANEFKQLFATEENPITKKIIRDVFVLGEPMGEVAKKYGISGSTVYRVCKPAKSIIGDNK